MKILSCNPTLHQTPCFLSPTLAAKITHETLGHLAEADGVIAAGVAAPILHLPKLPATITVVDYAHTAFGKPVPMPVYTDEEGTTARDVTIINQGNFSGLVSNRKTAIRLGTPLTGNARGGMVRTRNLALLPGETTQEAILATITEGYYLVDSSLDSSDPLMGDFASIISEGYRIQNGVICEPLPECTIYCDMAEFWQSVTHVGNDFAWITDDCTKFDKKAIIATGAPSIAATVWIGSMA